MRSGRRWRQRGFPSPSIGASCTRPTAIACGRCMAPRSTAGSMHDGVCCPPRSFAGCSRMPTLTAQHCPAEPGGGTMDNLTTLVTSIIALSVAAERVVEIIKGVFVWLDKEKEDPRMEARRRASLQALAAAAGVGVSLLAWPVTKTQLPEGSNP